MLQIKNLTAAIEGKTIFHDLSHAFEKESITSILGHNGSGKSSLALTLMGHPRYEVDGEISLNGKNITEASPCERHNDGMFLSFQNIPEIPGIQVIEYLRTIYNSHFTAENSEENPKNEKGLSLFVFRRMVEKLLPELHIEPKLLDRELFVGFSGGEKRKIELLQIRLLDPEIIILDEIDSGLDIDALNILQSEITRWKEHKKTVIIISHNLHLLDKIPLDTILLMKDGKITQTGGKELLAQVEKQGFTN